MKTTVLQRLTLAAVMLFVVAFSASAQKYSLPCRYGSETGFYAGPVLSPNHGILPCGVPVEVLSKTASWAYVKTSDGRTSYVDASLIARVGSVKLEPAPVKVLETYKPAKPPTPPKVHYETTYATPPAAPVSTTDALLLAILQEQQRQRQQAATNELLRMEQLQIQTFGQGMQRALAQPIYQPPVRCTTNYIGNYAYTNCY